jgi:hypothetical protein
MSAGSKGYKAWDTLIRLSSGPSIGTSVHALF